jgi:uncharacterized membrane-anchored protein
MFVRFGSAALTAVLFCSLTAMHAQGATEAPKAEAPAAAPVDSPAASTTPAVSATAAEGAAAPAAEGVAPAEGAAAQPAAEVSPQDALANSLVQRDGTVDLPGGQARVVVTEGFAYLDAADTAKLLTQIWGNPPGSGEGVLGAIVPKGVSVLAPESWAAIITYDNDGHVSDEDASSINYGDLLKEMQDGVASSNEERTKEGYDPITLVGWAQKPAYDAEGHKLHWAKHLQFGKDVHTLNYAIRALGRTGVLQVNVVADMTRLDDVNAKVPQLLKMVSFNEGNRYADFKEGDPVAAYGLAALVAGGIAAKAGLFKGLLAIVAASWKFIAIGFVALGGFIYRLFGGRKQEPGA